MIEIAGKESIISEVQEGSLYRSWRDVNKRRAQYGIDREYGRTDILEAVATEIEHISRYGTPSYTNDPTHNAIVTDRVRLLCEYGFLPATHKICGGSN